MPRRTSFLRFLLACSLLAGCNDRPLRPLRPCTLAGSAGRLEVTPVESVDLLFMIDDSGSMREEQEKLRRELPRMVTALLTGDLDQDGERDGPNVSSLRVGIVTSDMGVGGVSGIPGCGTAGPVYDAERAHYGDDGVLRRASRETLVDGTPGYDCDLDADSVPDSVALAQLPEYLTFGGGDEDAHDEFLRRVACFANVGTGGCAFEQPLESVLKAVTPPSESGALLGGAFHHAAGEIERSFGHGRGTDVVDADAENASWFRDDSLLAIVLVTDEDDCSASDPRVFDYDSDEPGYDDPFDAITSQTRCVRYGGELVHPVERFVQGLLARRAGRESHLVFAAITGIPADLTDEGDEGTDNLDAILADARMANTLQVGERYWDGAWTNVPDAEIAPACQHALAGGPTLTAIVSLSTESASLTDVTFSGGTPVVGMGVTGPGMQAGNTIRSVTGTGPYTVRLSSRPTMAAAGVTLTFSTLDVSAVPGRRIVEVARGLAERTETSEGASSIVQSICVDDFRPAVGRILRLIQRGLSASCLPRPLIRTAADIVACDVFVTLPEGRYCSDPDLAATYSQDPADIETVSVEGVSRTRCTMTQLPIDPNASTGPSVPTSGTGWYYDDFTPERVVACAGGMQRIAFAEGSEPPEGSIVHSACVQSVQDGDLALDVGAACTNACRFPTEAALNAFTLQYDLAERGFDATTDFRCEPVSNTCQIHCRSDAECPGSYVCWDDGGATEPICVNPVCGDGN